jgi:hypothetical protein
MSFSPKEIAAFSAISKRLATPRITIYRATDRPGFLSTKITGRSSRVGAAQFTWAPPGLEHGDRIRRRRLFPGSESGRPVKTLGASSMLSSRRRLALANSFWSVRKLPSAEAQYNSTPVFVNELRGRRERQRLASGTGEHIHVSSIFEGAELSAGLVKCTTRELSAEVLGRSRTTATTARRWRLSAAASCTLHAEPPGAI